MTTLVFNNCSGIHQLKAIQELSISKEKAWSFLINPKNLALITPPKMDFTITTPYTGDEIYAGQIISYKVSPFPFTRSNWVTEITKVKEGYYFIDEQRFGPYKMWHHEHIIEETDSGVIMTDIISYKLPFGFIGRMSGRDDQPELVPLMLCTLDLDQ